VDYACDLCGRLRCGLLLYEVRTDALSDFAAETLTPYNPLLCMQCRPRSLEGGDWNWYWRRMGYAEIPYIDLVGVMLFVPNVFMTDVISFSNMGWKLTREGTVAF
jgi:hypothetical protein